MKKFFLLIFTHVAVGTAGFAGGIYFLPILMAPPPPAESKLIENAAQAQFKAEFKRDLADSDALHWGEGTISISQSTASLMGKLAPGPDYKLYLSPQFVETEAEFNLLKSSMVRVGDVKTFENFVVPIPESIDPATFTAVIVWCEAFGQFITAAKYQ